MWVEQTETGKYRFIERYEDYITGKQKRVSVTFEKDNNKNRKLAFQALSDMISEKTSEINNDNISLSQLIEKYLAYQMTSVKLSTYKRNQNSMNTIGSILGADTLVRRINAQYIKERFSQSGKTAVSLNELRTRLNALLNWGYQNDYISDVSYLKKIKRFKEDISKKQRIQDKYLEPRELNALLKRMAETKMWDWYYITKFLVLSGLRIGELMSLKTNDIDMKNFIINVNKTFDTNNEIVTTPKTDCSIREVYIQPELATLLRKMDIYLKTRKLENGYANKGNLYFPSNDGLYLHYDAYRKYLRETTLSVLGRKLTPHALRHTHASLLLGNGVNIDAISRRLGHDNSSVTREIYLHVTKKLEERDRKELRDIKII